MKTMVMVLGAVVSFMTGSMAKAEGFPFPTNWQKILVCDNGAAWVDVNAYERRMIQVVIADENIIRHLRGRSCQGAPSDVGSSRCVDGKLILNGSTPDGVFESGQFRGFNVQGFSATCYSGYAPTLRVAREGRGLKVSFHQEGAEGCCWEMDSAGHCTSRGSDVPALDLANWYFQDCREL